MGTKKQLLTLSALAFLTLVSGCSSDSGSLELPAATQPTTTPTSSTTLPSTTTTTTTTESPGPTYSAEETAVSEAHTRFMTVINALDEISDGVGVNKPLIEQYVTGPQRTRMLEGIEKRIATGNRDVGPGYDSNIVQVEFKGELALVGDCSIDRGELISPDGEVLIPAATIYTLRETHLIKENGQWMITDFITGTNIGCNPDGPPWDLHELP